jgi:hypothetical protein
VEGEIARGLSCAGRRADRQAPGLFPASDLGWRPDGGQNVVRLSGIHRDHAVLSGGKAGAEERAHDAIALTRGLEGPT